MHLTRRLSSLSSQFEHYAKYSPTPVTMKSLIDFAVDADIRKSYKFLRVELLVRWSHMRQEMNYLPKKLVEVPSFQSAKTLYDQSFSEVLAFKSIEPDATTLRRFTETLVGIRRRHAHIVPTLARAYVEMENMGPIDSIVKNQLQYFYDRFFLNRIGVRTLIYQHTLLFGQEQLEDPQQAGIIDPSVDVTNVVRDAYKAAKRVFERQNHPVPKIEIKTTNEESKEPVTLIYIPAHLYHIFFELIKNSIRATVEHHSKQSQELPSIQIHIVKGHEDVTIEIADLGGGIPRSKMPHLFNYTYSTAPKPSADINLDLRDAPIAGLGYGLPIARLYAKYFHGNLSLSSVEGLGTWAYVSIKASAENASELLPIFSKLRYTYTTQKGADWT